jgi:hypothetical protein
LGKNHTDVKVRGMGDTLNPGESLRVDESIVSANGRYRFVYQDDGNLVLYKIYRFQPWRSLWESATAGRPAGVCVSLHINEKKQMLVNLGKGTQKRVNS